jgi:hypothetical protein
LAAALTAATFLGAGPAAAQMIYTQFPEPGETFVNSCDVLPLHAEPSALSAVVDEARFGDRFKVVGTTGRYLLPKSMRYSETHGTTGGNDNWRASEREYHERDFFYAWTEVETLQGPAFASTRCLTSPEFHADQTFEDAARKFDQAKIGDGGKGFSVTPASGGAGKGLSGQIAQGDTDAQAVQRLLQRAAGNPQADFAEFRREGRLGEYADVPNDAKLRDEPARDVPIDPAEQKDLDEALGDLF